MNRLDSVKRLRGMKGFMIGKLNRHKYADIIKAGILLFATVLAYLLPIHIPYKETFVYYLSQMAVFYVLLIDKSKNIKKGIVLTIASFIVHEVFDYIVQRILGIIMASSEITFAMYLPFVIADFLLWAGLFLICKKMLGKSDYSDYILNRRQKVLIGIALLAVIVLCSIWIEWIEFHRIQIAMKSMGDIEFIMYLSLPYGNRFMEILNRIIPTLFLLALNHVWKYGYGSRQRQPVEQ